MGALSSMTGFASKSCTTELGEICLEIKSVNSRFIELTFKIHEQLRNFEPIIRERIRQYASRGKFEIRLNLKPTDEVPTLLSESAVEKLLNAEKVVRSLAPEASGLTVAEILQFPGILGSEPTNQDALDSAVKKLFDQTASEFKASREREGAALGQLLLSLCDQIDEAVDQLEPRIPDIVQNMKTKLRERLQEAFEDSLTQSGTITHEELSDRIRQEVTLYAMKLDVQEEMGRLRTHVKECRRVIQNGGLVGRRLDFLMQELNREANTLGSKAASIEMTDTSVKLKVVIEQMREQIQNLE